MKPTEKEINELVDNILQLGTADLLKHSLEYVIKREDLTNEMKQTVAESLATAIWNATIADIRKFYQ